MKNDGIEFTGDSKLYYNYIDYGNISENNYVVIKKSNLLPTIVGDITFEDDNITLSANAPVIDNGLNPTDDIFKSAFEDEEIYAKVVEYLKRDYFGNERIVNGKIDIGASEYGATAVSEEEPNINIEFIGDQKVYYPITVNFTIETPNTISELYIDKGNGYESIATTLRTLTLTFDTAGEYTIKVKVVDENGNVGEFTKSITIYDLTTQEAIEYGKLLCQKDPQSCGISQDLSPYQDILENSKLTDTTSGWRLLGANRDLSVSEIFSKNPNISIMWIYRDDKWQAIGADSIINEIITDKGILLIDEIENGDGFWINVKP